MPRNGPPRTDSSNFQNHFGDIDLSSITSEQILTFLSELSTGTKPSTKRLRFTLLSAFFNFIRDSFEAGA